MLPGFSATSSLYRSRRVYASESCDGGALQGKEAVSRLLPSVVHPLRTGINEACYDLCVEQNCRHLLNPYQCENDCLKDCLITGPGGPRPHPCSISETRCGSFCCIPGETCCNNNECCQGNEICTAQGCQQPQPPQTFCNYGAPNCMSDCLSRCDPQTQCPCDYNCNCCCTLPTDLQRLGCYKVCM